MRFFDSHNESIDSILSGLSIFRWNTFPRTREITALDHLSFVAHIAFLIASLENEKQPGKYDILLLLQKILYTGFFTFSYSDINSEVKERLRNTAPELYRELETQMYTSLLSQIELPSMRADVEKIQQKSSEDALITFSKLWASYYEAYNNSLVYPDAYAKVLRSIIKRAEKLEGTSFFEYLDFDPKNQSDLERYLLVIHRLASSFRWNRSVRTYPVSVLSHTYLITFFTYAIAREKGFSDERVLDMMLTALFHDIPEAITGDIITPTKKAVPGLEAAIESIEEEMIEEYLLSYLDGYGFRSLYKKKMLTPWKEDQGDLVKLADMYSALYEAKIEIPHNDEFRAVYDRILDRMREKFPTESI